MTILPFLWACVTGENQTAKTDTSTATELQKTAQATEQKNETSEKKDSFVSEAYKYMNPCYMGNDQYAKDCAPSYVKVMP